MVVIYGTTASDIRNGTAANDNIYGWAKGNNTDSPSGNDTLNGNAGNDTLYGGTGFDNLSGDAGNDTLYGHTGNDSLKGGGGNDNLYGQVGNDTLDGGLGTDTLTGGTGNDVYFIDSTKDKLTEYFNAEAVYDVFKEVIGSIDLDTDTVQSSISYTLGDNLENLTLTGITNISGIGNALDNNITGNAAHNCLHGEEGDDFLDGGLGIDTLIGGTGNDVYIYNATDSIVEYFNQGVDAVRSSFSYTLSDNLENLTLTGLSDISGTGNVLNNKLTGNNASNFLYGGDGNDTLDGGLNSDTLIGGTGNDFYFVDSTGDTIVEYFNQGSDEVVSLISYTLGDALENLMLSGSSDINGIGNSLDNIISDNDGYNSLFGGAGNDSIYASFGDTLFGGDGNDYLESGFGKGTLYGDNGNDTLVGGDEGNDALYGGNGNDVINGGIEGNEGLYGGNGDDTLEAGVEGNDTLYGGNGNDYLLGSTQGDNTLYGGNGNDTLKGTALGNNALYGGNGNDSIVGGGEGNDTLTGGFGSDTLTGEGDRNTFNFYSPYHGIDTITDLAIANDTITVSASGFDGSLLAGAAITPEQFKIGITAVDHNNRFIYNPNTGELFFDADGIGGISQVQFASLSTGLAMTNVDIVVLS